jgi:hypothetical protein
LDLQNKYNIALAFIMAIPFTLQISTLLVKWKLTTIDHNKYVIGLGITATAVFGFMKFYWLNEEMDKKYTAIWLKSTGKLDK